MSQVTIPAQLQAFILSGSGSSIGDTVLNLKSFKDILGNNLSMAAFGSKGYGTLEPGNGSQEEQISFTSITQNSDGTAQLTGVSHVLFVSPFTESSGMTISHAGSVSFVISNTSGFENAIYTYINNAATGGGVPATANTQGITLLTINPATAGTPVAVGANNSKSGNPITSSNKVIDTQSLSTTASSGAVIQASASTGLIDSSYLPAVSTSSGASDSGAISRLDVDGETPLGFSRGGLILTNATASTICQGNTSEQTMLSTVLPTNFFKKNSGFKMTIFTDFGQSGSTATNFTGKVYLNSDEITSFTSISVNNTTGNSYGATNKTELWIYGNNSLSSQIIWGINSGQTKNADQTHTTGNWFLSNIESLISSTSSVDFSASGTLKFTMTASNSTNLITYYGILIEKI